MNEQIFELVGKIFATSRTTSDASAPAATTAGSAEVEGRVRRMWPREAPQPVSSAAAPRKRPGAPSRMPAR
jgi:hypothetical protein